MRLSKRLSTLAGDALGEAEESLTDMLAPYGVAPKLSQEGEIIRVPVHRVIIASMLKTDFLIGVLVFLAVIIAAIVLFVSGLREAAVPMLFGVLPAGIASFAAVRKNLENANFVVRLTDSGLAVSHGLVSTSRKVIPLDRVQAVCSISRCCGVVPDGGPPNSTSPARATRGSRTCSCPSGTSTRR